MAKKHEEEIEQHEIQTLQEDIAAWSMRRFGKNRSKKRSGLLLDSLAPLLGLTAKFGALEESRTHDDKVKAIEDVFLYLCDYASREDIEISHIGDLRQDRDKNAGLISIGKMAQALLHYHRKIIDRDEFAFVTLEATYDLIAYLNAYVEARLMGEETILIFRRAWHRVKKKRQSIETRPRLRHKKGRRR